MIGIALREAYARSQCKRSCDINKEAASSFLPRKRKFNNKAKEVNTHLQDIRSRNSLPFNSFMREALIIQKPVQ